MAKKSISVPCDKVEAQFPDNKFPPAKGGKKRRAIEARKKVRK
jgi:hypothetical protein